MARVRVERKVTLKKVQEYFSIYKKLWEKKYHEICVCSITPILRQQMKSVVKAIDENEFRRRVESFLSDESEYVIDKRHPIWLFFANVDQHGGKKNGTNKKRSKQKNGICEHGTFSVQAEIEKNKRARRMRN